MLCLHLPVWKDTELLKVMWKTYQLHVDVSDTRGNLKWHKTSMFSPLNCVITAMQTCCCSPYSVSAVTNCVTSAQFATRLFSSLSTAHHKSQSRPTMWDSTPWLPCSRLGRWDGLRLPDPALPHSWPLGAPHPSQCPGTWSQEGMKTVQLP